MRGIGQPRGVVREIVSAMSDREPVIPVAAVAVIFTTQLFNEELGPQQFAVYSLLAGLPLLIPFADLGLGAAITNTASTAQTDPALLHSSSASQSTHRVPRRVAHRDSLDSAGQGSDFSSRPYPCPHTNRLQSIPCNAGGWAR